MRNRRDTYRGPDFFLVTGVDPYKSREAWIVWEEEGKYPDLIVEFLSPSTEEADRTRKREIYEQVFCCREYFMYDPFKTGVEGLRLEDARYRPIVPDARGWLWSEVLGAWLGQWQGEFRRHHFNWLRIYRPDGTLVLTDAEEREQERQRAEQERQRAEQERQRAEQERQRAEQERALREQMQSEIDRLKARLRELGIEE